MKPLGLYKKFVFLLAISIAGASAGCATGKWGFIDKDEKVVFQQQFDEATPFGDGLAGVKVGDKWGFIDKTGKIIIEPQFEGVWRFHEGLAAVRIGEKWGFIDKNREFRHPASIRGCLLFLRRSGSLPRPGGCGGILTRAESMPFSPNLITPGISRKGWRRSK